MADHHDYKYGRIQVGSNCRYSNICLKYYVCYSSEKQGNILNVILQYVNVARSTSLTKIWVTKSDKSFVVNKNDLVI